MEYLSPIFAIAGTLGLLWLILLALRRFRPSAAAGPGFQVRQRIPIANGCHLLVAHWDGQQLLIATGNQPCTLIASRPLPPPVESQKASAACGY